MNLQATIGRLAGRHGVGTEAVEALARALERGGGRLARFDHPVLGGYGQWMPGMTQIGDMFNRSLRERVENLCRDLSGVLRGEEVSPLVPTAAGPARVDIAFMEPMKPMEGMKPMKPMEPMKAPEKWWPGSLGDSPNTAGGQNDVRYAYFAGKNRLAVDRGGTVEIYDTTGHQVSGVRSREGSGGSGLEFTSDQGKMDLASLEKAGAE